MTSTTLRRRLRRTRRRTAAAVQLTVLRARLRVLERVAPAAADRLALDLWCTFPQGARRTDLRPRPGVVERVPVPRGGTVAAESWGEGPTVLLVHGWGGWRGQLGAFVEPLVDAGHRVVALDAPGHGDADHGFLGAGRGTVMEFLEAIEAVAARTGPVVGVVAHSMGTMATARAVASGSLAPDRLVLVAPSHPFLDVLDQFTALLRLSDRTRDHLRATLETIVGSSIEAFDLARCAADATMPPTLVVHDRLDRETPFAVAEAVVATWDDARLVPTTGLGHHRVLAAPTTVTAAVEHLTGRVPVA
ncbi:alpha/beta fold hydrolase [Actinotalea sp. AC32]|nr:alpha/beta fold hydrolase [Actinotalea sp. AC32]